METITAYLFIGGDELVKEGEMIQERGDDPQIQGFAYKRRDGSGA